MRIDGWHIDGYGVHQDLNVRDLPEGLTIVHGLNETGKSTLQDFLVGMLFGFARKGAKDSHPPLNGGAHGGRLFITVSGGQHLTIHRGGRGTKLRITATEAELTSPDDVIESVIGTMTKPAFESVFAVHTEELNELSALSDNEVRDLIFSASVLGAGHAAKNAITTLESTRDAMWKPKGRLSSNYLLANLNSQLTEARESLASAQQRTKHLSAVDEEIISVETELEKLRFALESGANRSDLVSAALTQWTSWSDGLAAAQELDDLGPVQTLPDNAVTALETLSARLSALTEMSKQLAPLPEEPEIQNAPAGASMTVAQQKQNAPAGASSKRIATSHDAPAGASDHEYSPFRLGLGLTAGIIAAISMACGVLAFVWNAQLVGIALFALGLTGLIWVLQKLESQKRVYLANSRAAEAEQRARSQKLEAEQQLADSQRSAYKQRQSALRQVEDARDRLRSFLMSIGVTSVEQAGILIERNELKDRLDQRIARATNNLSQATGQDPTRTAQLRDLLRSSSPDQLQLELDQLSKTTAEVDSRLRDQARQLAKLEVERRDLENSADIANGQLRVCDLETQLAEAYRRWAVAFTAHNLLTSTLTKYQRERQPAVVKHAGGLFAQITSDRYVRLEVRDRDIFAIDHKERDIPASRLSRGTLQQLYLCIRFALASYYCETNRLPLLLDDVTVHADDYRLERVAEVIASVASQHQVLLFTGRQETVDLLVKHQPDARVITLGEPQRSKTPSQLLAHLEPAT